MSLTATMIACGQSKKWVNALALLEYMYAASLEPNDISFSASACACEVGEQWETALALLDNMC